MTLSEKIQLAPESITFPEVIAYIDAHYDFTPTRFTNGTAINEAGQNNGSCKIFFFAKLQGLSQAQTLALFGDYYRVDVLGNASGTDHQNIRNFIQSGWDGIRFEGEALREK
ncbi:HopJ type III effector protein [Algoriphagus sp. AK58]|uniref:HopJ type III effector protein n=1 Tax=Algoriphagus sp. AK58 TaxID=1406877 RepID=UPI00164FCC28|nr:HopJ type III effector protein [Algoriphagus sp. AK58]MBC6368723.1 type III effector [Algoriphagus sp. AK58]